MLRTRFSALDMFTHNVDLKGQIQDLHEGLTLWDLESIT